MFSIEYNESINPKYTSNTNSSLQIQYGDGSLKAFDLHADWMSFGTLALYLGTFANKRLCVPRGTR